MKFLLSIALALLSLPAPAQYVVWATRVGFSIAANGDNSSWNMTWEKQFLANSSYTQRSEVIYGAGSTLRNSKTTITVQFKNGFYSGREVYKQWNKQGVLVNSIDRVMTTTECHGLFSAHPYWFGRDYTEGGGTDDVTLYYRMDNSTSRDQTVQTFATTVGIPDYKGDAFKVSPHSSTVRIYPAYWLDQRPKKWTDINFSIQ